MQQTYTAAAIILGSLLIAGAILVKDYNPKTTKVMAQPGNDILSVENLSRAENPHTYGNEDASVRIVEFSDFECPFCARLHPTLKRVVDESEGQVVWEYRHLPLPSHTNARAKAIASECVARELGNEAFWDFSNTVLTNLGKSGQDYYVAEANKLGADTATFTACLADPDIETLVDTDLQVAQSSGGRGTPFSVIIGSDGTVKPVSGALPYESWVQTLSTIE